MNRLHLYIMTGALLIALATAAGPRLGAASPTDLAGQVASRSLRRGDQGEGVLAMQELLKALGFDPGPLDGIFGPLTQAAVLRAQEATGVAVDGVFGSSTLAGLTLTAGARPAAGTAAAESGTGQGPYQSSHGLIFHTAEAGSVLPAAGSEPPQSDPGEPEQAAIAATATTSRYRFALTFNGAPEPQLLPAILTALDKHQMKATFFISGAAATARPDLVGSIAAAGHEIGSGGLDLMNMTRLSPAMIKAQLAKAQQDLQGAAGQTPRFFRPPLGETSLELENLAAEEGLTSVLWTNVTARDVPGTGPQELADRMVQAAYPGAVIMLHQDRPSTVAGLDVILEKLLASGFRSVPLSGLAGAN